ncbi:hypothetical protein [Sphingomonas sp. 8AM]|uniref:hypothetical protein n=1 Tax=Sphingomonas sp. 8AM TaxID=2653170 RepID=UPI0012F22D0F|nr:hypothetical protein [Sphingomonas sp. 8AM]VXD02874.1 conserved membrane hypothetical protein [Sphingomonas sp. 8AM]
MCIDLFPWDSATAGLTFGQLANVQTVGIGLYLALAVIQAVSSTGVAGLSRRLATLRSAVATKRMRTEIDNVRRLSGEVSGIEIGFHDLNRRLLGLVSILFTVSVGYFAYCTIWQNIDAGHDGVWFIFFYYLALPISIFFGVAALIWKRCRDTAKHVKEAESRIRRALLGL